MWHGTTRTTSKTTLARMNERIPHKPSQPAEPPPTHSWQRMHKHNLMLPVWEYQTQICAWWCSTTPTTRETTPGKMNEQIPHKPPPPAEPPPARPRQKENKQLSATQQSPRLPIVLTTQPLDPQQSPHAALGADEGKPSKAIDRDTPYSDILERCVLVGH